MFTDLFGMMISFHSSEHVALLRIGGPPDADSAAANEAAAREARSSPDASGRVAVVAFAFGVPRSAVAAAALAFLVGCTFSGTQVRKHAAIDFGCPEDEIVVHELPSGYLARGCRKEVLYFVQDGMVTRDSEITKATVDERPPLPIDSIPNTNSIGVH